MGRYKGKRLKQSAGIFQSNVCRPAVSQHDEEPGATQAAADAPNPQPVAALPRDEEPGAAETETAAYKAADTDTPAPADKAADTDTPAPADSAAPSPKKSRRFLIVLAVYAAILLAVTGYLQITLWRFLKGSQAEMDRQAAEQAAQQAYEKALYQAPQLAFEDWRSGLTAGYWTDLWCARASGSLDEREAVQEFMAERFAPDAAQAFKAAGYTDEAPVYVLKNGADSLARVTMAGSGLDWSVSEVELLIEGSCSVFVTVAERCQVYCNGKKLGGEYTETAGSRFRYEPLEGRLEGAVTWVSYRAEGLLLEPELTVEPPEGYSLIRTEEGDYLLGMAEGSGTYADTAVEFVRAYLYYYMSGEKDTRKNMNSVLSCLTPGTQAYQDIRDTYIGVYYAVPYTDIDTSKTTAGDVIVWADNCFSVDVTYDANCKRDGAYVDYADATMRIYFLPVGSKYVISHFEVL